VILYERFRGYNLSDRKRLALFMIFAFFINMIGYSATWLRGLGSLNWSLGVNSTMTSTSFVVKYMALSLVSSVALSYVICLLRYKSNPDIENNKDDTPKQDEMEHNQVSHDGSESKQTREM